MNDTTIGALLNTSSQVSTTEHRLKTAALSIPRGAFLGLIRLNVWGLATLLSKKALGFKLAPKQIKEKLKAQGIGGYDFAVGSYNNDKGIGVVSETAITAAAAIVVAVMPLIQILMSNIKKDLPVDSFEEINYVDEKGNPVSPPTGADDSTSSSMAGAGLIGLAALAAIYFGTMTKK